MKKIVFILLFILFASCQEEKGIWNELTEEEQNAVRQEAEAACLAESGTRFTNFKSTSANTFSSDDWVRNKQWRHILKNGEVEDSRTDFQVWKRTSSDLYLWVKVTRGSEVSDYFLKIKQAENEDMIDDIQSDICTRAMSSTTTSNSGPVSATKTYTQTAGSEKREFTDTYNFDFSFLAFFGANHNLTRKIVTKKVSNDEVISTINLTSSFSSVTGADDLRVLYTDGYTQKFCEVSTLTSPYAIPYILNSCPTVLPGDWDLSI